MSDPNSAVKNGPSVTIGRALWLACLTGALGFIGTSCEGPDSAPPGGAAVSLTADSPESAPPAASGDSDLESAAPRSPAEAPAQREWWESQFIEGKKVGHAHFEFREVEEGDRTLLRKSGESVQKLKRYGQTLTQEIKIVSYETPDGEVVRFETSMSDGSTSAAFDGVVDGERLRLTTTTAGKSIEQAMPWDRTCRGFFASEDSMRKKPMSPGETREFRMWAPFVNQPAVVELAAEDYETAELPGGEAKLLKVRGNVAVGGVAIKSVFWVDEQGETLKSLDRQLNLIAYRTSKAEAARDNAAPQFDLGAASTVRVARRLERPHETRRILYTARLKDANPKELFAECETQNIRSIDEQTAQIEVRAVGLDDPPAQQKAPTEEDNQPNSLIQSDDQRIVAMAQRVAPDETDPGKIAKALEAYVRRNMRTRQFAPALASAADVAASLEGDCTEHAVLLAALCRARGIPARVAIGLVYYPRVSGFAYHMWNEVWTGQRWLPLDATLGRGGIGAAHLKLADSNLEGAGSFSAFLPVTQVMGKLELEILEVE